MRRRCVSGNTVMFLEARLGGGGAGQAPGCGGATVLFRAEEVGVSGAVPHTQWLAAPLLAEAYNCGTPPFLRPESSRREARAVLSRVAVLDDAQLNFYSEKIAAFLSAASFGAITSPGGGSERLLVAVELQLFRPLQLAEEE